MNLAKHFVKKWKFGKMEIWNAFFYKTSRNGIPFHRESTVTFVVCEEPAQIQRRFVAFGSHVLIKLIIAGNPGGLTRDGLEVPWTLKQ